MQEQRLDVLQKRATNYLFFHMAIGAHLNLDTYMMLESHYQLLLQENLATEYLCPNHWC